MNRKLNIAMMSDFFYPAIGGIETHIEYLSEELIKLGHKVIVITHKMGDFFGLRMVGNIKVYFLDIPVLTRNVTFPGIFLNFSLFKEIFEDEEIEVVHGHQTMSNLCIEGLFHAKTLNLKTVLTEHSLFDVGPFENIVLNSLCRVMLGMIDRCICVSYTSKENVHARTCIPLERIYVIPNAILSDRFYPSKDTPKEKAVIVVSRLVFRKGVDLLIGTIPLICKKDSAIKMVIVGDGNRRGEIEQVIDEHGLYGRVIMLGEMSHERIGDVMRTGDVFLNTSLLETFGIAIVEAALCGLHVVSTNVGGIHEVLPPEMITFSKPTAEDLAETVLSAMETKGNAGLPKYDVELRKVYSWERIARKTEEVYFGIENTKISHEERKGLHKGIGGFFCKLIITIEYLCLFFINSTSKKPWKRKNRPSFV